MTKSVIEGAQSSASHPEGALVSLAEWASVPSGQLPIPAVSVSQDRSYLPRVGYRVGYRGMTRVTTQSALEHGQSMTSVHS